MQNTLGWFSSVPEAKKALAFVASFPGNGGKKQFTLDLSGEFPSVNVFLAKKPFGSMSVEEMRGALRAWRRLQRKK